LQGGGFAHREVMDMTAEEALFWLERMREVRLRERDAMGDGVQ